MSKRIITVSCTLTALALFTVNSHGQDASAKKGWRTSPTGYTDGPMLPGQKWKVHDIARPKPPVVDAPPGKPPSDAIVLFDGKDLSQWQSSKKGGAFGPPGWKLANGYAESVKDGGDLAPRKSSAMRSITSSGRRLPLSTATASGAGIPACSS
jgi:hypothetical protein